MSRQSAHRFRLGCQPYAPGRALHPRNIFFFCFWYSFMLQAEQTLGPSAAGRDR
jgi:hypothetical protein